MTRCRCFHGNHIGRRLLLGLLLFLELPHASRGEATAGSVAGFDAYCRFVEGRLATQHRADAAFLVMPADVGRIRGGALVVERVVGEVPELRGAMLHHWRGTAFAPGARAEDFERLMRDFRAYPQRFAPEVVRAGVTAQSGDHMQVWMRVRQHHVITVVMDTDYDVTFGRVDGRKGYSISRSTRVAEIGGSGTGAEHVLGPGEEHGFLWRLNTYWSYEERDGGLYLQMETVSLTRAVPGGLGWAVRPYVESIPRESMEFTLRSACVVMESMGGQR